MREAASIRRIVVALDASTHSEAALRAAVRLAAALGAELVGVYVEDSDLVELADLPFAQEVDAVSGECRPLRMHRLRGELEALANRVREALRGAAQRHEVRWSFQTVRGRPSVRLAELAAEADLVTVGLRGRSPGRGAGSTVRALLSRSGTRILVTRTGRERTGGVQVVDDGTREGREALRLAIQLARGSVARGRLVAFVLHPEAGEEEEEGGERAHEVEALLADAGLGARSEVRRWSATPGADTLLRLFERERPGLLLLGRGFLRSTGVDPAELTARSPGPVLVVG